MGAAGLLRDWAVAVSKLSHQTTPWRPVVAAAGSSPCEMAGPLLHLRCMVSQDSLP